MGTDLAAVAASVVRLAEGRAPLGRTRVIGVDGRSGSGKTTFAEALAYAVQEQTGARPPVLHMDQLYPGWEGLAAATRILADALAPLAEGRAGACPTWDWTTGTAGPTIRVDTAPWLVVEGVGCGAAPARPCLTVLVWLEADIETRYARAIARDGDAYLPHWSPWAAQEDTLFARDDVRASADAVLRTD